MTQFEKLLKTSLILSATLATLIIISAPSSVFGAGDEPGKYLDRKAEIWNLFFKMMVVAFTIGSVVSGTIVWLCWRFRESARKAYRIRSKGRLVIMGSFKLARVDIHWRDRMVLGRS